MNNLHKQHVPDTKFHFNTPDVQDQQGRRQGMDTVVRAATGKYSVQVLYTA